MKHTPFSSAVPLWRDGPALVLLVASTLKIMANVTIAPALAGLALAFVATPQADLLTRMLIPAPSIAVMLLAPIAGVLADRYGRRNLLVAGVILFGFAGTAGAYLPSLETILISRVLLGVAVAMVMTAQTALIGDLFQGERRTLFLGWQIAATNFGGAFFIGTAGILADLSLRLPFAIYGLGFLLLPFILMFIPKMAALSAEASATTGRPKSMKECSVRTEEKELNYIGTFSVCLVAFVTVFQFFMMPTQFPFFVQHLGLDAATITATGLVALTVTGGFAALLHGRLVKFAGLPGTYGVGYGLMACGFLMLSQGPALGVLLVATAAIGGGYALVMPNFFIQALSLAPATRRGFVSGLVTTALFSAQCLSPLVLTPMIGQLSFQTVFGGAGVLLAAGSVSGGVLDLVNRLGAGSRRLAK